MANPVEEARLTTISGGTSAANIVIDLPAGIVAGEGLLITLAVNDDPTVVWPAGWTEFYDYRDGNNRVIINGVYRDADGTEGSTVAVTLGTAEQFSAIAVRYSGVDFTDTPPESATGVATGDPPEITPTSGSQDYKILAPIAIDTLSTTITTFPTGYSNTLDLPSHTAGPTVRLGMCELDISAASEDPPAYVLSGTNRRIITTIAITPVSSGAEISADINEAGDTTSASIGGVAGISAGVIEVGDTTAAAIDSVSSVNASVQEDGDATLAAISSIVVPVSNVGANVQEAGDSTAAQLESVASIGASIAEDGDTTLAEFRGVSGIAAIVLESGDVTGASLIVVAKISANVLEQGDLTQALFSGKKLISAIALVDIFAAYGSGSDVFAAYGARINIK